MMTRNYRVATRVGRLEREKEDVSGLCLVSHPLARATDPAS